jgi:hypothetical protein
MKANTFSELVNMALTQEDCITAHHAEKKRRISTGPASVQPSRYRFVWNAPPGRLVSGRLSNPEDTDLQCLCNSHNSLAHGQTLNNFNREAAPITVSIVVVRTILSKIVRGLGSLIKGKVLIRITRTSAKSQ